MIRLVAAILAFLFSNSVVVAKPPSEEALRSVDEWKRLADEMVKNEHEQVYLPMSQSRNSWQYYNLAYAVDGNIAVFRATGDISYLDRALLYVENCMASAKPSKHLKNSQFKDDYLAWPAYDHPEDKSIKGGEYPLFESYLWRYVTVLLRAMREVPNVWDDVSYRKRWTSILTFTERHIFDKWYERGTDNLYRSRTHMAAHWAFIALNLSSLTNDRERRKRCEEVVQSINTGLPNYKSSLRKQLQPHAKVKGAVFWSDEWGVFDPPGQDVAHGNNVVAYLVEAYEAGTEFKKADIESLTTLLLEVIWTKDGDKYRFAEYVDGSGMGTGWFSDGFMKLGRYSQAVQRRLEKHDVGRTIQFFGNGMLNARYLTAKPKR